MKFNLFLSNYVNKLRGLLGTDSGIGYSQAEWDKAKAAFDQGLSVDEAIAKEAAAWPSEKKQQLITTASNQGQDVSGLVATLYPEILSPKAGPAAPSQPPVPAPIVPVSPIEYLQPGQQPYQTLPVSPAPAPNQQPLFPPQLPVAPVSSPIPSVQPTFPSVPTGAQSPLFNPGIPASLPEQVQIPIEAKPIFGLNPADEAAALKRESELEQRANAEAIKAYLAQEEANAPLAVQSYLDLFQPAVEKSIRKGAGLFAAQGLGSGGFEGSGAIQELVRRASENATQMAGERALDQLLNARSHANLLGLQNTQLPSLFRQQALTRGLEGKDIASERLFDLDLARLAANTGVSAQRSQTKRAKYGGIGSLLGGGLGYLAGGPIGGLFGGQLGNVAGGLF